MAGGSVSDMASDVSFTAGSSVGFSMMKNNLALHPIAATTSPRASPDCYEYSASMASSAYQDKRDDFTNRQSISEFNNSFGANIVLEEASEAVGSGVYALNSFQETFQSHENRN